ncbi:shikimate dehydrogenase [Campylobacter sp. MIT 21-1685]|uniref:shikimate dehydrogenase n=1 Tax=unclassified Campylobacter TaxID=2593542 RepID=UPI00224AAF2D|nr:MULTISPECIES: shikimate dehydrogenase [unclassified Campylobacter]MCX2682440.1 shikimate dehydrogenase [Campylobacter sp. MIT 21-1684]MCX2750847.1 shikimate dehydrogenase [Campylobacter sp. MIT 21-1682]MCX2806921.1 shikimate dehydrogenase [Campylobacter sp. MIT 21-1685]
MKFLAVIGNPICHSKSPRMHNNAIKSLQLNGVYTRYKLENEEKLKNDFLALGFDGANITLPFKQQALKIADIKDELALNIGSANTLLLKQGKIYAYNTDALGFLKAIEEFQNVQKVLILGAGGTALALAYALQKNDKEVCIANRSEERFVNFKNFHTMLYENLQNYNFDLIINTTSAGLNDEQLPCSQKILDKITHTAHYAFEVIYGKETAFLQFCKQKNLRCKNGLEMLLWQGVFAFELFFDIKDEKGEIKKAMSQALELK